MKLTNYFMSGDKWIIISMSIVSKDVLILLLFMEFKGFLASSLLRLLQCLQILREDSPGWVLNPVNNKHLILANVDSLANDFTFEKGVLFVFVCPFVCWTTCILSPWKGFLGFYSVFLLRSVCVCVCVCVYFTRKVRLYPWQGYWWNKCWQHFVSTVKGKDCFRMLSPAYTVKN